MELTTEVKDIIQREINELRHDKPKCDFEHIWNCAINEASNCLEGYDINSEN